MAAVQALPDLREAGRELADATEALLCAGATPTAEVWHRVEEALAAYDEAERAEQ